MEKRLLIVDGQQPNELHELQLYYALDRAHDIEAAKDQLAAHAYDLILLNMKHTPEEYAFMGFLREEPSLKWLPVIVVSEDSDIANKTKCYELGAADYMLPICHEELRLKIESQLNHANQFEMMAFRDPLTKSYNRRYFEHQIQVEVQRAHRSGDPISLAFIDADRFKSVNDTFGHHVGDLVLIGLAGLVQANVRATDIVSRYGGEEFVILLPGSDAKQAVAKLNDILAIAHQRPVAEHEGRKHFITFSAGVCQWDAAYTIDQWIKFADDAAYEAKKRGRDQVVLSTGLYQQEEEANTKKGVLLLDNSNVSSQLREMNLSFELYPVQDLTEWKETIGGRSIELCIVNAAVPGCEAFDLFSKEKRGNQALKFIVISDGDDQKGIMKALSLGIDHFLPASYSAIDLELAVKRLLY